MRFLFWRKDPEPEPEPVPPPWAGYANLSDMVEQMIAMEYPASEIVWVTRVVELRRRIGELEVALIEAKRVACAATEQAVPRDAPVVQRNRVRNHATRPRATTRPKRKRAAYYREYRAKSKLRLVASNPPKDAS